MTWIIIAFFAGMFVGVLAALILAVGSRADDYEPIEHEPESRIKPQIWDGFNRKEPT